MPTKDVWDAKKNKISTVPLSDKDLEQQELDNIEHIRLTTPKLPDILSNMLTSATADIIAAVTSGDLVVPAGLLTDIYALNNALTALSFVAPVKLYAIEAHAKINALEGLPGPMEAVRQQMLTEIAKELE